MLLVLTARAECCDCWTCMGVCWPGCDTCPACAGCVCAHLVGDIDTLHCYKLPELLVVALVHLHMTNTTQLGLWCVLFAAAAAAAAQKPTGLPYVSKQVHCQRDIDA